MNDRELLEMAAKAAGYSVRWHDNWECFVHDRAHNIDNPPTPAGERHVWVPLHDDGDALRLAARLRLAIKPGKHHGDGCSVDPTSGETCSVTVFRDSKDMAEQMRHAIVRAAAEIGRTMP